MDLIKAKSRKRYTYDLSHKYTFCAPIGQIIPINTIECLPGDTLELSNEVFVRTSPFVHPILQQVKGTIHHFFVPYRLIYPDLYDKVLTSPKATDGSQESFPQITITPSDLFYRNSVTNEVVPNTSVLTLRQQMFMHTLLEHLGFPITQIKQEIVNNEIVPTTEYKINALSIIAYILIYNEYFRDSLKIEEFNIPNYIIGDVSYNNFVQALAPNNYNPLDQDNFGILLRACNNRDYFNTAQHQPQYGDASTLPIEVNAVTARGANNTLLYKGKFGITEGAIVNPNGTKINSLASNTSLYNTTAFTINNLKELFSLQSWSDIGNMFGKRYIEQVLGHFGVKSSDARLQRPDYIGYQRFNLQISEVTQLSQSDYTPLGTMAGRGVAYSSNDKLKSFFCEEHGLIMSLLVFTPEQSYGQGLSRFLMKSKTFDFAFPEFANLGEQEVYKRELFCDTTVDANQVLGYQERYAEYKRAYNRVSGPFLTSLKSFTMATIFDTNVGVTLNSILTPRDEDIMRTFAIENYEQLYIQVQNNVKRHSTLQYVERIPSNIL